MVRIPALAVALLLLGARSVAQPSPAPLEVRFAPSDHMYLAQENRNFALASLAVQNAAIINSGGSSVTVKDVLIEILIQGDVFRSERLGQQWLQKRWARLKRYLDTPDVLTSEDPRFRFKELLGDKPKLA